MNEDAAKMQRAEQEIALDRAISTAITTLYAQAQVAPPSVERPIVPLGELVGNLNLTWTELPTLTSARAIAFLRTHISHLDGLDNGNDERLAGFLYASSTHGNIFVEHADRITRRRFSIAHEVGHYLLHLQPYFASSEGDGVQRPLGFMEALPRGEADEEIATAKGHFTVAALPGSVSTRPPADHWEYEANRFAGELLMPVSLMPALVGHYCPPFHGDDLLWRLSNELLVSQAALRVRFRDLGLLPARRMTGQSPSKQQGEA